MFLKFAVPLDHSQVTLISAEQTPPDGLHGNNVISSRAGASSWEHIAGQRPPEASQR